ncbi:potassium transporter TrkA [Capsulimonas corticalis]|uniref:Potassium transporter TrkA n=1 Tax=Capsulimonas corticalis TaxID=2219043 RepID=A0A402CZV1_9BACT|nr:potassium channel protein [Capsulimonas corticalis]BDI33870.1 potassium transporter TrkA [Capsulimonas corticalis]
MKRNNLYPKLTDMLRNPFVRLRLALFVGALLGAFGTAGYMGIEHYGFLDAVYMTVITLSSVGYGTVRPLDIAGEIFTIFLIVVGLGTAAWVFSTVIEVFVSEQSLAILTQRRMKRVVDSLNNHYIICGYGRIGQEISLNYSQNNVPHLVMERDPGRVEMLRENSVPFIEGDAADDETLKRAGIDRAAALIAVTPTDAVNTFIVLSARGLRPDLYIVARADSSSNEAKLYRAGASKVVSPHILGGRWMGITAINPAVTDFITAMTDADHDKFQVREFVVLSESEFAHKTFGESRLHDRSGALVVAVRRVGKGGHFLPNPADSLVLGPGDVLIAIGSPDQLKKLGALIGA